MKSRFDIQCSNDLNVEESINLQVSNHQRAVWGCYSMIPYVLPTLVFGDNRIWDSYTIFEVAFMDVPYDALYTNTVELHRVGTGSWFFHNGLSLLGYAAGSWHWFSLPRSIY